MSTNVGTFHNVSGLATITGSNTVHISNFTYNGGGIEVYFYLANADTTSAIPNGVRISGNVLGSTANNQYTFPNPNNGQQLGNFDLTVPAASNIDLTSINNAFNVISIWCQVAQVDFASGTFAPVPEPTLASLLILPGLLLKRPKRFQ